ncbi:MAG: DUF2892 domain-containing protein [Candidatus Moranbacteria bacterium]|nr:DUF2892 domain-containing protein [Candidatus Moranbacteria bacterium]
MYKLDTTKWTVERIMFLIAGIFIFGSLVLSMIAVHGFFYFAMFVGAMLIIFSLTGFCPMAIMVDKIKSRNM